MYLTINFEINKKNFHDKIIIIISPVTIIKITITCTLTAAMII